MITLYTHMKLYIHVIKVFISNVHVYLWWVWQVIYIHVYQIIKTNFMVPLNHSSLTCMKSLFLTKIIISTALTKNRIYNYDYVYANILYFDNSKAIYSTPICVVWKICFISVDILSLSHDSNSSSLGIGSTLYF